MTTYQPVGKASHPDINTSDIENSVEEQPEHASQMFRPVSSVTLDGTAESKLKKAKRAVDGWKYAIGVAIFLLLIIVIAKIVLIIYNFFDESSSININGRRWGPFFA